MAVNSTDSATSRTRVDDENQKRNYTSAQGEKVNGNQVAGAQQNIDNMRDGKTAQSNAVQEAQQASGTDEQRKIPA